LRPLCGVIRKALEQTLPGATIAIDFGSNEVAVAGDAGVAEAAIRAAGAMSRP
jgi:copper chaperone